MTISRHLCGHSAPELDDNRDIPNRPSIQFWSGRSNHHDCSGERCRYECSIDESERHDWSMESTADMNRSGTNFVGSKTVMQRKMSKKNKLFKQYGIAPYTGSIEKNKENSMTWRHQPIKKGTTWLNAMKESKAVECLVTLKNSSFGLVRSNRGTSHGYAKMFENENFSQNSNMAS